jgi:Uma2 family endonuclease
MAAVISSGYTIDDFDWVRANLGVAHVELDPWGNLIVTPPSDLHEYVVSLLVLQLGRQLSSPEGRVVTNGLAWRVPGGSGYLNMPDVMVLERGWRERNDEGLVPAPLLVVEVASPSTRTVDRGRKLDDYMRGGADAYLLVDVPTLTPVREPTFELHRQLAAEHEVAGGRIRLAVGPDEVELDLTDRRLLGR